MVNRAVARVLVAVMQRILDPYFAPRRSPVATHYIEPERRTLHGHFSRDLPPALTIDSGDTVVFRTLDAGWHTEPPAPDGTEKLWGPRDSELDTGHCLCGPVAIRGAKPGMTLVVRIDEVRPGTWGRTFAGGWEHPVNRRLGMVEEKFDLLYAFNEARTEATNNHGRTVELRPFMGVMGMPPPEPGIYPTAPPRVWGGNIDCKELVAGTTLFLPVGVEGGLFSTGDGHGRQGDGEVSVTAIECPMDRVALTFTVRDDMPLTTPRALTGEGWLTLGFHEDLDEAAYLALDAMLGLMGEQYGFSSRNEALAMASVVVDLRVTQIVNGVRGAHAVLPHGAIR